MIKIYTPSGIGDVYWLLMKLAQTGEKIDIHVPAGNTDTARRSNFLENLDIVNSVNYDSIQFAQLKIKSANMYSSYGKLNKLPAKMFLECNTWLENGQRIENYLPKLETTYKLNWKINDSDIEEAEKYLKKGKKNVIIYTSSIKNNDGVVTGTWTAQRWKILIDDIQKNDDINLIWIGARYDADILNLLNIDNILIDSAPGVIIHLLRNCSGFISYQSGLSVISVAEGIPTAMLYFRKIEKMLFTFCPKTSIADRNIYLPLFFDNSPEGELKKWIEKLKKI